MSKTKQKRQTTSKTKAGWPVSEGWKNNCKAIGREQAKEWKITAHFQSPAALRCSSICT